MTTVVLCGMPEEARILRDELKAGTLILSGTDKFDLPELVPPGTSRLVCMGLCGGLAPDLVVPDVALATEVFDRRGDRAPCDQAWNAKAVLAAKGRGLILHPVSYYSSGLMDEADTVAQRAALFTKYGTHAIDDESRYVVAEAQRRGIPVNVARPLSDDYRATLPLSATGPIMNRDGSTNIAYLLWSLGQNQGANSESLGKVWKDYDASLTALRTLARSLADLIASGA